MNLFKSLLGLHAILTLSVSAVCMPCGAHHVGAEARASLRHDVSLQRHDRNRDNGASSNAVPCELSRCLAMSGNLYEGRCAARISRTTNPSIHGVVYARPRIRSGGVRSDWVHLLRCVCAPTSSPSACPHFMAAPALGTLASDGFSSGLWQLPDRGTAEALLGKHCEQGAPFGRELH